MSEPTKTARSGPDGPATWGRQHELRHEDQVAVVTEVGAHLRVYEVGHRPVIVAFDRDEEPPAYHGAVLLPWPNRIRDGRYTFDGVDHELDITEPARHVALHGLAHRQPWSVLEKTEARLTLALDLPPATGYPFSLTSRIAYELGPGGLSSTLVTTNAGDTAAPYGVGFHPWLSPGGGPLDECMLSIDAETWVQSDERLLPIDEVEIPGLLDFRIPRRLDQTVLDDAFVGVTYREGRSWIRLTGTDGRTAAVWTDESMTCWQVCSGDAVEDLRHVRSGLAAEPMTCTADAFRTGRRLIRLEPGESHEVRCGLALL